MQIAALDDSENELVGAHSCLYRRRPEQSDSLIVYLLTSSVAILAQRLRGQGSAAAQMATAAGRPSLYIGNIPSSATEASLRAVFGHAGELTSVRLIRDKETQKPKGFGFVDYADMAGAVAAMRTLQGADLDGQKLRLDWADRVAPRGVDNLRSVTQLPQEDALTAGINGLTAEQLNELLIRLQLS